MNLPFRILPLLHRYDVPTTRKHSLNNGWDFVIFINLTWFVVLSDSSGGCASVAVLAKKWQQWIRQSKKRHMFLDGQESIENTRQLYWISHQKTKIDKIRVTEVTWV